MLKWQKAWLAAAIDGEGCIYIGKQYNAYRYKKRFEYVFEISIANTCKAYCDFAKKLSGFGKVKSDHSPSRSKWRTLHKWYTTNEILLQMIMPYFVIKQGQAKLYVEAKKLVREHTSFYTPHNRRLEQIYKELRVIK